MKKMFLCLALGVIFSGVAHSAANQGIVATVNDQPITTMDIQQRLQLLKVLGERAQTANPNKAALKMMVDEIIKIAEAKKYKMEASDRDIQAQLGRMAKGMKTDPKGLEAALKKNGIETKSLQQLVAAQIGFSRILNAKYKVKFTVEPGAVDKKMGEIKTELQQKVTTILKDPRMQPVQIYTILEIDLPVENKDDPMLLQARAQEASQYLAKFNGCASAKAAAEGIFNVKIGKKIDAVAAKLPPPMKKALDGVGVGKAVGPARGPKGIQVIGFCGKSVAQPPKPKYTLPTREQVEAVVSNEQYAAFEEKYMVEMRKHAYVEYKDTSYAQQ